MTKFLADPDDPLVTADGEVYSSGNKEAELTTEVVEIVVPAKKLTASMQRTIRDFPAATPNEQTIVNVVMVFHLLGMNENEMSHHLGVSIQHVQQIKESPAFQETYDLLFQEVLENNRTSAVAKINAAASRAVDKMIELVTDEEAPAIVQMKASENVMNRAGLSEDKLHGKHRTDDSDQVLHIVIDDGERNAGPSININFGNKDGE